MEKLKLKSPDAIWKISAWDAHRTLFIKKSHVNHINEDEKFEVEFEGNLYECYFREFFVKTFTDKIGEYVYIIYEYKGKVNEINNTFSPIVVYNTIKLHLEHWAASTHADKFVVGISGGKDSTVVASLLVSIFGKERVHGVLMPSGTQSDIQDSYDVVNILGISHSIINVGESVNAITKQIWDRRTMDNVYPSKDMEINLPARIRMATLHAVGQCINGRVINTSNLSEDMVGYATQFGDNAGAYAPIQGLTVTEVKELGKYVAQILKNDGKLNDYVAEKHRKPDMGWSVTMGDGLDRLIKLIDKVPVDGLQSQTDEERLGFTYDDLDKFIRLNEGSEEFKAMIRDKYQKNKFKLEIVQMPQPDFSYLPNFVKISNN